MEFIRKKRPQKQYKFCSHACANAVTTSKQRKEKIEKPCAQCGVTMMLFPYHADRRNCCSTACYARHKDQGKTAEQKRIRTSAAYAEWRMAVFERDDFTCQLCNERGGKLHADHIKRFADHPELRLDVNNGRTLCAPCHRSTETFGNRRIAQEA